MSHDDAVRVTWVLYFETFEAMLDAIRYTAAMPTTASQEEARAKYRGFYSEKDEEQYGLVALLIKVINE